MTANIAGTWPVSGAKSGRGSTNHQSRRPPREHRPRMTTTRQVIRRGQNFEMHASTQKIATQRARTIDSNSNSKRLFVPINEFEFNSFVVRAQRLGSRKSISRCSIVFEKNWLARGIRNNYETPNVRRRLASVATLCSFFRRIRFEQSAFIKLSIHYRQ